MRTVAKGATAVTAPIDSADAGGFTAIASTGEVDRDGERILPGAFSGKGLPASIPVHLDHTMRAADVVARARPYYVGDELRIDATFGTGTAAQEARRLVADGLVDTVSIVFLGEKWQTIDGVRCLVQGNLLACDLVSIPANASARVVSVRSLDRSSAARQAARAAQADALLTIARAELTEAKALIRSTDPRGPTRQMVDDLIADALTEHTTTRTVRAFLRSL